MHVSASTVKHRHHTVVLTAQAVYTMQRFLQEHGEVRITALGIAVAPAVSVAEILKNRQLATEKQIFTALESVGDLARYLLFNRLYLLSLLLVPHVLSATRLSKKWQGDLGMSSSIHV